MLLKAMRCKYKVCHANTLDGTKCMSCVGPKGTNTKNCSVCWQHKLQCQVKKLSANSKPHATDQSGKSKGKSKGAGCDCKTLHIKT